MIYASENNWYSWKYGDGEINGRQTAENLKLSTYYSPCTEKLLSFEGELHRTAESTMEHYPGLQPNVFFSGGVDSELILRAYLGIGANPKVYIVRYEDDLNIYDVSYAVTVCSILNVPYNIIDFKLKKFYENDAMSVSEQAQIDRPSMLPHLKFTDCADGLIIVGHSDIAWMRLSTDYSKKVEWIARDYEHDLGCDKYNAFHNRPAIYQWWKWTPGIVAAVMNLEWFKKLTNDEYYGKLGINSTKVLGFREAYPDIIPRSKQTGFEKIRDILDEVESHIRIKYNGLPFRQEVDRTLSELIYELNLEKYR